MVIDYRNQAGRLVNEVLIFENGLVVSAAPPATPSPSSTPSGSATYWPAKPLDRALLARFAELTKATGDQPVADVDAARAG